MARFYGRLSGRAKTVTRTGTQQSGIGCHVSGWDVGVEVDGHGGPDVDAFDIFATPGSNGGRTGRVLLGRLSRCNVTGRTCWVASRKAETDVK